MTMRKFPTPEEIVSKGARDILACWKTEVKRGVGIKRAEQLCAAAEVSIGLKEGIVAARVQLRMLLEEYDLYLKQEEQIMNDVLEILGTSWTAEMLSIPGVGVVTIAGFLAEIGDINSYDHGQQIIRLATDSICCEISAARKDGYK